MKCRCSDSQGPPHGEQICWPDYGVVVSTTTNQAYTEISIKKKKNEADAKGSSGFSLSGPKTITSSEM
jgi:hypothetical protein